MPVKIKNKKYSRKIDVKWKIKCSTGGYPSQSTESLAQIDEPGVTTPIKAWNRSCRCRSSSWGNCNDRFPWPNARRMKPGNERLELRNGWRGRMRRPSRRWKKMLGALPLLHLSSQITKQLYTAHLETQEVSWIHMGWDWHQCHILCPVKMHGMRFASHFVISQQNRVILGL